MLLQFGLIGFPLTHSFSAGYFSEKFEKENIAASYKNYPVENLDLLRHLVKENNIRGFNVTIPYKEKIIPLLDDIDQEAKQIGAVNCVKVGKNGLTGYNTDITGFEKSFLDILTPGKTLKALIFGSGGSGKMVQYSLKRNNIPFLTVSRNEIADGITYQDLDENIMREYRLLVNTTPVGMYPDTNQRIQIPYRYINENHIAFDLIYNPVKTQFLLFCEKQHALIKNGLDMLHIQAEESYRIFME